MTLWTRSFWTQNLRLLHDESIGKPNCAVEHLVMTKVAQNAFKSRCYGNPIP